MEGKNLEAVKNTADNFKSILPKDKLSVSEPTCLA